MHTFLLISRHEKGIIVLIILSNNNQKQNHCLNLEEWCQQINPTEKFNCTVGLVFIALLPELNQLFAKLIKLALRTKKIRSTETGPITKHVLKDHLKYFKKGSQLLCIYLLLLTGNLDQNLTSY